MAAEQARKTYSHLHHAEVARQKRPEEPADVDHLVEDAPAQRGGVLGHLRGDESLDARLEDGRAEGQEHRADEEDLVDAIGPQRPCLPQGHAAEPLGDHERVAHDEIADHFQHGRHGDVDLVAVAIGETAGENRDERLDDGPDGVDAALLDLRQFRPALLQRGDHEHRQHDADAVVGETLDHLHPVGQPVDGAERSELRKQGVAG